MTTPAWCSDEALVEELMLERGIVRRDTTGTGRVQDEATGKWSAADRTIVYPAARRDDGRMRVVAEKPNGRTKEFGGRVVTPSRYIVSIPTGAPALKPQDEIEVTSSPNTHLTGTLLRVAEFVAATYQTRQLYLCDVVESK